MIWNLIKGILPKKQALASKEEVPSMLISQGEHSKPKTKSKRKPKLKKEKIEPKVDVLKFEFDPNNPKLGSIELDWNSEFIDLLRKHGYRGSSEEEIIDQWINDVCRTIADNQFQGANLTPKSAIDANLVTRKNLGDGKTEVS